MSETGHIIGGPADPDWDGSVLTAALVIGDTVLHVEDVADFDEDAAERDAAVLLGMELDGDGNLDPTTGTAMAYTAVDDDAGTVTLAAASTIAADAGDRVYIQNAVTGLLVGEAEVLISVDGSDTTGDALPATLSLELLATAGNVDLTDQAVEFDEDEDGQLVIGRFLGLGTATGDVKFMQDQFTVSELGAQTLTLSFEPILNSEHLYWHPGSGAGIYQPGSEWSRDRWDVSVPDPDGRLAVDDALVMEYAYRTRGSKPVVLASMFLIGSGHVVSGATSIDLPSGTVEGDLIVLAIAAHAITPADCPDDRILVSHAEILNPSSPTMSSFIGYGIADASGDPLPLTLPSASRAEVAVFRTTGTLDSAYTTLDGTDSPFVLDVPGGDLGIAVLVGVCHLVPAPFGDDTTGEWTTVSPGIDSDIAGAATSIVYCTSGTPLGSWPGLDSGPRWGGLTIGLTGG